MMTTNTDILTEYFNWMCRKVDMPEEYSVVMRKLQATPFRYILPRDGNRYEDGINLRYQFAYEKDIPQYEITSVLDYKPCSVLEMMVALAIRCEVHIMHDPECGDRTGYWFREMMRSLGLLKMTNALYNEQVATDILNRFLDRKYESNGRGGLFVLYGCEEDARSLEIWYQMAYYLREVG